MTNQMKKLLIAMLVYSYCCIAIGVVLFCITGFSFESVVSYIYFGAQVPLALSLQILLNSVNRREEEVRQEIERINILLKLREGAKLKFYKDFGIIPKYDENGKLLNPDDFIGILSILTKDGELEPSIYEILGILPRFDKDGNEIPFVTVVKHLVESFKKKDLDKLKIKTLKFKTENNKVVNKEIKKVNATKVLDSAKKESKSKEKSKTGKPFKEKKAKSQEKKSAEMIKGPKQSNVVVIKSQKPATKKQNIQHEQESRLGANVNTNSTPSSRKINAKTIEEGEMLFYD